MSTLVDEAVPLTAPADAASPFRLTVEGDGLAVLVFDTPGEKVNKFSTPVMREFERVVDALASRSDVKALLFLSAKPGIFIAGADVNEIAKADRNADPEMIRGGHRTFNKLANLPFPTVAAIDGACVGGGCETTLSMDWRLISDSKKAQIGLPEIKLGILPAWGGTTRLPRMVGLANALDVILAGKVLDGKRAKKIGLVDEVVPQAILEEWAKNFARAKFGSKKRSNAGPGGGPSRVREPKLAERLLEGPGRRIVFGKARESVLKETKGHYPAPLAALSVVEKGFSRPFAEALELEVEGIGSLIGTPVMRSLVGLFFRMEEVKKETGVEALGGAGARVKPRKIGRIGVLGAGVMGGGIAQLAADKGFPTRMKDIKPEALALGFAQAARIWKERLKKRRMTRAEFAAKMSLLGGSLEYAGFEGCDITIEAVLEKMSVKQAVLADWEHVVSETAIFASNTSTLPITEIASKAAHPERVVGMHFFNPVDKMPLVEVIYGQKTDPEVTATVFDLAKKMGKTPVVVKDSPGFLVNRILGPYIGESVRLLIEGNAMESIDKAMRTFGMPVGPIELLDDVGIDVAAKAGGTMAAAFPERLPADPTLEKLVTLGRIGRKAKKGFYFYEKERRGGPDGAVYVALGLTSPSKNPSLSSSEIQERLLLPMINEAAFCLADGIVASPAKLDLAMIFGTGFPPFRGGLCAYADALGAKTVVEGLEKLSKGKGGRFNPAPLLVEMARAGKRFFE
ncbi:MAG: 3-hydroxyacyl-CoA dehydrogenase NAD-binding domain-containing protein [Thermoanaerobaculia bacterium]|nr:3-hydroxyacyl-CoA dehydrogenase NAD-binding domain-containing protein [Thermoanaerobaculia bacterium]